MNVGTRLMEGTCNARRLHVYGQRMVEALQVSLLVGVLGVASDSFDRDDLPYVNIGGSASGVWPKSLMPGVNAVRRTAQGVCVGLHQGACRLVDWEVPEAGLERLVLRELRVVHVLSNHNVTRFGTLPDDLVVRRSCACDSTGDPRQNDDLGLPLLDQAGG